MKTHRTPNKACTDRVPREINESKRTKELEQRLLRDKIYNLENRPLFVVVELVRSTADTQKFLESCPDLRTKNILSANWSVSMHRTNRTTHYLKKADIGAENCRFWSISNTTRGQDPTPTTAKFFGTPISSPEHEFNTRAVLNRAEHVKNAPFYIKTLRFFVKKQDPRSFNSGWHYGFRQSVRQHACPDLCVHR